jgi:hypothetical protein
MGNRREERREAAAKLRERAEGRSAGEQLSRLDGLLGAGRGAARERLRLQRRTEKGG